MRALLLLSLLATTLWATQGDIVLSDSLHPQVQLSWNVDVGKMKDSQLYDMIARFYGAPRTPTSLEQLRINIDLFSRPQGFLFFSIGGLSGNQMPQSGLKILTKNLIDLIPHETVSSSYPLIASILTGTTSEFHGVHNHYTGTKDVYAIGNFFDAMHRLHDDKKFVSASSSMDGALVLSPHLKNFGSNTKSHYWDPKVRSFVSVSGNSPYGIGIKDFSAIMTELSQTMETEISYHESERTVSFNRPGLPALTLDLSSSSVEALFAEVLFVLKMSHTPVNFLSFHFDSLTEISNHFGTASEEYVLAVHMIDSVIAKVYSAYKLHHSLEMSIIYCPAAFQSKEVVNAIEPVVADVIKVTVGKDLFTTISDNLPHIYLSEEGKARSEVLCNTLKSSLNKFAVAVDCSSNVEKRAMLQSSDEAPAPAPTPAPIPPVVPSNPGVASRQEVELVHIVLWVVLAMICALLQACYHLSVLDGSNEPEFKPKTYEGGIRSKTTKIN